MFDRQTYVQRRDGLGRRLEKGLVLLPGNGESPMNYADNAYAFRQDSTFLYYFGLDQPDLATIIDVEAGTATIFGNELDLDTIVWMGDLPTVAERAERVGVSETQPRSRLAGIVSAARSAGRPVHYLPPYRADSTLMLAELLDVSPGDVGTGASAELIRAVVDQRSYKSADEIAELEQAITISVEMHRAAGRMARPGVREQEIAAEVARIASASGGRLAYPIIGTINGQTLHNHVYPNTLSAGDLYLLDAGAETARGYAGDLTSTFPVSGSFDERQRTVYDILLRAYEASIATAAPGVPNLDVHMAAARAIFDGMKQLGIMKGNTEEALAAGAHALVFPHGIGHMMGLDVHDMENLGEQYVGYDGRPRSRQFGLKSLRLTRKLEPGFVITIEPGIYFIPQLIDDWRARGHNEQFIDFDELDRWRDFGGMRNEEDFLITTDGSRRLGPRKPQTIEELAQLRD
ncbi:MAG: aminopeptidase P family protein [Gemmatimonadota bacterium]